MRIVIVGSEGTVGKKLRRAFSDTVGVDLKAGADIRADLADVDYDAGELRAALTRADALIHLGTSPDAEAPEDVQWRAVANAARLYRACAEIGVPLFVVASSDWAQPKTGMRLNAYAHSKRALEAMSAMYGIAPGRRSVALRVGWVPRDPAEVAVAPAWLAANYWDDARLIREFSSALGI